MPIIDKVATLAWFHALMTTTGCTNAYQVSKKFDPTLESKRFEKYARGTMRPSRGTLNMVELQLKKEGRSPVCQVFDDGPEGAPLWDALSGDFESLWVIVDQSDPDMPELRKFGTSLSQKIDSFLESLFPGIHQDVANGISAYRTKVMERNALSERLFEEIRKEDDSYTSHLAEREAKVAQAIADEIESHATSEEDATRMKRTEQARRNEGVPNFV